MIDPKRPYNETDVSEVFGVVHREDPHSDLIVNAFNQTFDSEFRSRVLDELDLDDSGDWAAFARRRITNTELKRANVPDIVLARSNPPEMVVIENKLWSGEGEEQLARYNSEDFREALANRLELSQPAFKLVYLTLDEHPETNSSGIEFKWLSWRVFCDSTIAKPALAAETTANRLLLEFAGRVSEANRWSGDGLDTLKEWFEVEGPPLLAPSTRLSRLITEHVDLADTGIKMGDPRTTNNREHGSVPLIQLTKPGWRCPVSNLEEFGSTFDVHFEIQWLGPDKDDGLSVEIHCETNPYMGRMQANLSSDEYAQFKYQQARFKESLISAIEEPWKPPRRQGWVGVARVEFEQTPIAPEKWLPSALSPSAAGEVIQSALAGAVQHVDSAIQMTWGETAGGEQSLESRSSV